MNAHSTAMLLEGQEAIAAASKQAREYRETMFRSTMELVVNTLTANTSEFITFLGACEPEYEVRPTKIVIVWQIEPWLKFTASRAIANNIGAETFSITGYIGLVPTEAVFTVKSTDRREHIMTCIAKYLEECTGMQTVK